MFQLQVLPIKSADRTIPSPENPTRRLPAKIVISAESLAFGVQTSDSSMEVMRAVNNTAKTPITVTMSHDHGAKIVVQFATPPINGPAIRYRQQFRISEITRVQQVSMLPNRIALVFSVALPPEYRRELTDTADSFANDTSDWSSWRIYERITTLTKSVDHLDLPIALFQDDPFVDLGRWLTFAIEVQDVRDTPIHRAIGRLRTSLHAYNINVTLLPAAKFSFGHPTNREMLHMLKSKIESTGSFGSVLDELIALHSDNIGALDFEVRYLLEACVSQNILYEGSFSPAFIGLLITHTTIARNVLENALLDPQKRRFYDAIRVFDEKAYKIPRKRRVPSNCVLMHTATVTPTTVLINAPSVEISNRVVRKYEDFADHFLRIRFAEEDSGPVRARNNLDREVYARVHQTLTHGLDLAGRHYEFLAYGNSQFREHGAYLFAPTKDVTVQKMRAWMGNFKHIKQVARYASRLGQCFSTTRAITSIGTRPLVKEIPDIVRDGFTFTDGVGKISVFLAQMIAGDLGHGLGSGDYPSVFQFRLGGYKGVLVVAEGDLTCQSTTIQIRPSQNKFFADYSGLEIIRHSSFSSASLNSQVILVLNSLGIKTATFVDKMRHMLSEINAAMSDNQLALRLLRANVDTNQMTVTIAKLITCGLGQDPFVRKCLKLWRAWSIKYLKEKFRILIEDGAFILGCIDETATLKADGAFPQIFLQISDPAQDRKKPFKIITGKCILMRNPSLHPGDIRVVEAVECENLRHLKNVVVLPQTGERPLSNMCAGGDLDGDDYMVIWDQSLIPPEQDHPPMDYVESSFSKGEEVAEVTTEHIVDFFVDYMQNNSLGQIAIAHRVWADWSPLGVKDPKCLELASLHSQAVDYAKSGKPARMTPDLFVKQYPHWMNKPSFQQSYHSKAVLGVLYDDVERVEFRPDLEGDSEFSPQLLSQCKFYEQEVIRLMNQFGLKTEFEAFTAFAMDTAAGIRDYEILQDIGSLMQSIKNEIKELCFQHLGVKKHECRQDQLAPLVLAMYKVTVDAAIATIQQPGLECEQRTPFLSLPFVFAEVLDSIMATCQARSLSYTDAEAPQSCESLLDSPQSENLDIDTGGADSRRSTVCSEAHLAASGSMRPASAIDNRMQESGPITILGEEKSDSDGKADDETYDDEYDEDDSSLEYHATHMVRGTSQEHVFNKLVALVG